ncbi:MAG: ribosome assembly factor SBDS [Nanoarchaeota archaeon]|nr:ribosome assembly factor SBDS [Nanoarchaeota archaeon]
MRPTKIFDQEAVKFNLVRIKKGGQTFEVIIDPDRMLEYKNKKISDVREVLRSEELFFDAKRGEVASESILQGIFNTSDTLKIAELMLHEGDVQFTQEYRDKIRADKRNKIIEMIARNAIDPRTKLPHPRVRIEAAFDEAKVRIDEVKDANSQIETIVDKLRSILPIKFATKEIQVKIGPTYAAKSYATVEKFGKIKFNNWQTDGSWVATVEIPAGLQNDFFDALNKLTHGEVESKIIGEE